MRVEQSCTPTHLSIAILASASCADEGFEVRFHGAADDGVQTLVWSLITAEEVEDV